MLGCQPPPRKGLFEVNTLLLFLLLLLLPVLRATGPLLVCPDSTAGEKTTTWPSQVIAYCWGDRSSPYLLCSKCTAFSQCHQDMISSRASAALVRPRPVTCHHPTEVAKVALMLQLHRRM